LFYVDTRASSDMLARFAMFQDSVLHVVLDPTLRNTERAERLRSLGVPISLETARALISPSRSRRVLLMLGTWLHDISDAGLIGEKQGGNLVQGYRTISLRNGQDEQPRAASLLFDRREALALVQQR